MLEISFLALSRNERKSPWVQLIAWQTANYLWLASSTYAGWAPSPPPLPAYATYLSQ